MNLKPIVELNLIQNFLNNFYGKSVQSLQTVGGQINSVYSYKVDNAAYILRLNSSRHGFDTHDFVYKTYGLQGIPISPVISIGNFQKLFYCITREIPGIDVVNLSSDEFEAILPSFLETTAKIHRADISRTEGYGNIDSSGNGLYKNLEEFLEKSFSQEIEGFWYNWHKLYNSTVLEKHVFHEFYDRMMELSKYSKPYRHLLHGDYHFANILTDGKYVTGVIDWDGIKYGDFLYDIATLDLEKSHLRIPHRIKNYYKDRNIDIPHFKNRFLFASYFRGIDCLRFHAAIKDEESYYSIKKYLYGISSIEL
jgi:hygromycin-B 4-O-kinase